MTVVLAGRLPHEGCFWSERHRVVPILCDDTFAYWVGLAEWWATTETVIHLDHDIEATDSHIDALLACEHPACTWSYTLHWASSGIAEGISAQKGVEGEFCSYSGLGLIKLSAESRIAPLPKALWPRVEWSVNESIAGPWHLHGVSQEIPHHHW